MKLSNILCCETAMSLFEYLQNIFGGFELVHSLKFLVKFTLSEEQKATIPTKLNPIGKVNLNF